MDDTTVDTRTLTVGVNMILTPRVSNTLRGNYSTQNAVESRSLDSFGGAVPPAPSVFLGSLSSASTSVTFSNDDTSAFPLQFGLVAKNHATQLNFVDDLSVVKGVHTLKFGGDYRAIYTNVAFPHNAVGLIADTVQAFLASSQLLALSGVTTAPTQFLSRALSLYAQDSWKVTPRLAMTYGVRWELNPAPKPRGATTFVAWQNLATPSQISLAPPGTPLWNTTHGNFAPRFGIAYRLTQRGDFILRGGAGLFYDLGVGESASVSAAFPNLVSAVVPSVAVPATNLASLLPSISLQPPFSGMMYAFSPDLKLPLSYQWNVALEKSFGGRQTVAATYVGQIGRRLLRQQGLAAPNSNFKAGSRFFVTANDSSSDYNALQLQYRRPLASRIQAILNYTWSHSLDDASSDIYIAVANAIISNKSDRGPSSFDVRHSFSGALSYDVPSATESGPLSLLTRGWTIDAVIVARSGFPFNAVALLRRLGPAIARPDLVPGQPVWISDPGAPGGRMLNPLAFKTPPPLRQGTEGRNDIPGFGLWQVDLSIGRKFPLTERINLQFRADAFNLFNHPNFSNPLGIFISPASTTFLRSRTMANVALGGLNPLFQEDGPRSLQFSLRLSF